MIVSHDEHLITAVSGAVVDSRDTQSPFPFSQWTLTLHVGKQVCDELWIIRDKRVNLSEGDFEEYSKAISKAALAGR